MTRAYCGALDQTLSTEVETGEMDGGAVLNSDPKHLFYLLVTLMDGRALEKAWSCEENSWKRTSQRRVRELQYLW